MTNGPQLAGAVFCLWGGLIIGGGAVAQPKIRARFGKEAVHLFESVVGPGRSERKVAFVQAWDALPTEGHDSIVESCRVCMQSNNDILCTIRRNPWWFVYLQGAIVVLVAVLVYQTLRYCS